MSKKHYTRLLFLAASILLLYSCVKDVLERDDGDKQAALTLEQAKAFYVSRSKGMIRQVDFEHASCGEASCTHGHTPATRSLSGHDGLRPLWFRAREFDNGKVFTQVIPLDGGVEQALYQRYAGYLPIEASGSIDSRLVIQRLRV